MLREGKIVTGFRPVASSVWLFTAKLEWLTTGYESGQTPDSKRQKVQWNLEIKVVVLTKTRGFEACFLINISIMSRTLEKNKNYKKNPLKERN